MEPTAIQVILTSIGSVVTGGVAWVTSFIGCITANPLILLFVAIPVVGLGVGLLKRLIKV